MADIKIETYKEIDIYYDVRNNKFICKINEGSKKYSRARMSLLELRKAIDLHFTKNKTFEPIDAYYIDLHTIQNITVTSIRVDGAWQARFKDGKSRKSRESRKIPHYNKGYVYEKTSKNLKQQNKINVLTSKIESKNLEIKKLRRKIRKLADEMTPLVIKKT